MADRPTVLVVDDTPDNLRVISTMLADSNFRVLLKKDGPSALALVQDRRPDIILLDVMMPGMDGYEVCRRLKANPATADIPVLFMSALTDVDAKVRGFEAGGFDYIPKPFQFEEVLARVNVHLELRRAQRQIERRNEFIKAAFGRYLSDEVVDELLNTPDGLKLGGQTRMTTILLSDLRGFSTLCEHLSPDQVVRLLNIYLGAMAEIIQDGGGMIDEFLGDAVLAVFGTPVTHEDDATRAVACAIEMQRAMGGVNAALEAEGLPAVEMGIGLSTGDVVVGNIGSERRTKYSVVGRHVNLAARIESFTVGGQVLVSGSTAAAVGDRLQSRRTFLVRPKGMADEVCVHDVIGLEGGPALPDPSDEPMRRLGSPLAVRYLVLSGKDASGATHPAEIVALSTREALVRSKDSLDEHDDLRLALSAAPDEQGFAKVVGHRDGVARIRFTSLPPALRLAIENHPRPEDL